MSITQRDSSLHNSAIMLPNAASSQTGSGNASVTADFEYSNPTFYSTLVRYMIPPTTALTLYKRYRFGINRKYKYPMSEDV